MTNRHEWTVRDIAEHLGIAPASVRAWLHRRGIRPVRHEPSEGSGPARNLYSPDTIRSAPRGRQRKETTVTFTSQDMRAQIARAAEAREGTYDVDAILDELITEHGAVDIDTLDADAFWSTVARHAEGAQLAQVVWITTSGDGSAHDAVEPGPASIDIPDDVIEWAQAHGVDDSDDVYLMVVEADEHNPLADAIATMAGTLPADEAARIAAWRAAQD